MSGQKIPDKSNFLEKFAAIESYLKDSRKPGDETQKKIENNYAGISSGVQNEGDNDLKNSESHSNMQGQDLNCIQCGFTRKPNDVFCPNCGYQYGPVAGLQNNSNSSISILKCTNCNTPYNPEDVFCESCGNKLQNN